MSLGIYLPRLTCSNLGNVLHNPIMNFDQSMELLNSEGFLWEKFSEYFPFDSSPLMEGHFQNLVQKCLSLIDCKRQKELLLDLIDTQNCVFLEQCWILNEEYEKKNKDGSLTNSHIATVTQLEITSQIRNEHSLHQKNLRSAMLDLSKGQILLDRILNEKQIFSSKLEAENVSLKYTVSSHKNNLLKAQRLDQSQKAEIIELRKSNQNKEDIINGLSGKIDTLKHQYSAQVDITNGLNNDIEILKQEIQNLEEIKSIQAESINELTEQQNSSSIEIEEIKKSLKLLKEGNEKLKLKVQILETPNSSEISVDEVQTPHIEQTEVSTPDIPEIEIPERDPFVIQIGLDFGTAYTKCVYRDISSDTAFLYTPQLEYDEHLPFLIPSKVALNGTRLSYPKPNGKMYSKNEFSLIKTAFSKIITNELEHPSLIRFKIVSERLELDLYQLVECIVIFYLSNTLLHIRKSILNQSDYNEWVDRYDLMAINMGIPVGDIQNDEISEKFEDCLRKSWLLSLSSNSVSEKLEIRDLLDAIQSIENEFNEFKSNPYTKDICRVYPETAANLQSYVNSRNAQSGIFLIMDIGAGTVDQSVFTFGNLQGNRFSFLSSDSSLLGSSKIEELACSYGAINYNSATLESMRMMKESNERNTNLYQARIEIKEDLKRKVIPTIARSKNDYLPVQAQIYELKIIYCGGGYSSNPYSDAAKAAASELNRQWVHNFDPETIGLPYPDDIELSDGYFNRLTVAYGLSQSFSNLAVFSFPLPVPAEQRWQANTNLSEIAQYFRDNF